MRNRKPITKKAGPVVIAKPGGALEFTGPKKKSTEARINELLILLNIDKSLYKFQALIRQADRLENHPFLSPLKNTSHEQK